MSDYFEMAKAIDAFDSAEVTMHPAYNTARKKLRDIRRFIKTPLTSKNVIAYGEMWREAPHALRPATRARNCDGAPETDVTSCSSVAKAVSTAMSTKGAAPTRQAA